MKEAAKSILKLVGIYHPLQLFYRGIIKDITRACYRYEYKKYKGGGYTCNYCQASYSKFAPWYPAEADKAALEKNKVIAGYGENIVCPNCLSTARERLIKALLETRFDIGHKKILHLSPEAPVYQYIKDKADVVAADYMPGFYKNTAKSIRFADATRLAYDNAAFDMVIANHIMEHIPDDRSAMREIRRVLKPGGVAILQVPFSTSIASTLEDIHINNPESQSALFGQKDHVRIYQLDNYLQRLREAGFTVDYFPYESLQPFYRYAIQQGEGFIAIRS
ncbi:MAG TPA: methyltransferase domain-containing protein [Chitinophagaceae bacterium]|nr:methyltransferase domain-containing protein [Chitinophagaceae bacterium]